MKSYNLDIEILKERDLLKQLSFKRGDWIISKGQIVSELCILETGEVEVSELHRKNTIKSLVINQKGQCMGSVSFLTQSPSFMAVKALKDTNVYLLPRNILDALLLLEPDLAMSILEPMANTICMAVRSLIERIHMNVNFYPRLHHNDNISAIEDFEPYQVKLDALPKDGFLYNRFLSRNFDPNNEFINYSVYRVDKNKVLFNEGQKDNKVFIVISGSLQTFIKHDNEYIKLTTIPPGGEVGIVPLLDGKSSHVGCMVREESLLIAISKEQMNACKKINLPLYKKLKSHFMYASSYSLKRYLMYILGVEKLEKLELKGNDHV